MKQFYYLSASLFRFNSKVIGHLHLFKYLMLAAPQDNQTVWISNDPSQTVNLLTIVKPSWHHERLFLTKVYVLGAEGKAAGGSSRGQVEKSSNIMICRLFRSYLCCLWYSINSEFFYNPLLKTIWRSEELPLSA